MPYPTPIRIKLGSQTHVISDNIICSPLWVKNFETEIGETFITLSGKKYLFKSNGENIATPKPPVVSISRSGWLTVERKNDIMSNLFSERLFLLKNILWKMKAIINENIIE